MLTKTLHIFAMCLLLTATAFAGGRPNKMLARPPLAVNPDADVRAIVPNYTPATGYVLGPGDSIGYAWYDYGTNGTYQKNIINYGDGTFSVGRMAGKTKGFADRATYYTYFNGTTWSTFNRIETAKRGFGSIDQFVDGAGTEIATSHGPLGVYTDAAKGAGSWTPSTPTHSDGGTWPKLAAGRNAIAHIIAPNATPDTLYYWRTQDAGSTFDMARVAVLVGKGGDVNADGYDVASQGQGAKVAIVKSSSGNDIWITQSTDDGATWTDLKVHDVKADSGELKNGLSEPQNDGGCAATYDINGNLHLVWGNYLAVGDSLDRPVLYYSLRAPLLHWSSATGVTVVAFPAQDTMILKGNANVPGVDGGLLTMPSIGFDASNKMYVVYQGQTSEMSNDTLPFCHLYASYSTNGGVNWTVPTDITPVTGSDQSFPSLAKLVDANLHVVYFTDAWPGNNVQGNQPDTTTTLKYLKVAVSSLNSTIAVGVSDQNFNVIPDKFNLQQNYPNPFNPSTMIGYTLTNSAFVTLKVYNVLGQEVATLVNDVKMPGSYAVNFDASRLAAGFYMYRLQAGSFSDVKKMVLVK